jgi:hypothetical protein
VVVEEQARMQAQDILVALVLQLLNIGAHYNGTFCKD